MLHRFLAAALLLTVGYLAGTLAPTAQAADAGAGIVTELRNIHTELTNIRRALEKR